jgi:hypothetical protein
MCSAKQRTRGKVSIVLTFFLAMHVCNVSSSLVNVALDLVLAVVFVKHGLSLDTTCLFVFLSVWIAIMNLNDSLPFHSLHEWQPREEQVRLRLQELRLLKLVAEEVNKGRKSRLNCWEKESARTTGSRRNPTFRKDVINYYQRESRSKKSVKCQILDVYVRHAKAQDTIIAGHIWKASTRGKHLEEFGLSAEAVNDPRNGFFLTKGIEDAFDKQQVCFLYHKLDKQLYLWVADEKIQSETIEGSNPPKRFADVHQKPLCCPDTDCVPFRRLLSWHARLTLERWKQSIRVPNYTSKYDCSPGRDSTTLDPISQAIDEMVEPGEEASIGCTD